MYPEDCLHNVCSYSEWWVESSESNISRGDLISVHVPFINSQPFRLVPIGRKSPTDHGNANFVVEPHDASRPPQKPPLAVAGLPLNEKEMYYAYRAKDRPAVVISTGGSGLSPEDRKGGARWRTSGTMLVAPCSRFNGFSPHLKPRIRHCEWPQFMWDILPHGKPTESVVMFGQLQPIGVDFKAYRKLGYRLCENALEVYDDWLGWLIYGTLDEQGDLLTAREVLLNP